MIPLRDENPTRRRAYVTVALILLNIGVYFFWQPSASSGKFEYGHAVIPCELTTQESLSLVEIQTGVCVDGDGLPRPFADKNVFVAIVVSLFLHGSVVHLGGNMLFLWVFGNNIEDRLGHLRYIAFYLASGVVATLAHVAIQSSSTVPLVGASGAIAGIMGGYLLWYPNARVLTWAFFLPAVIRAKWLLIYWFVSQFFVNPNEGVAWAAHVGGFIAGLLLALIL